MGKYIEWYCVEVERRLLGRISSERVVNICAELHEHLTLKANDLIENGAEPLEAERIATEAMGPIQDLTNAEIDSFPPDRATLLARRLVAPFAVAASIFFCLYQYDLGWPGGVSALLVVAFTIAVVRSRRYPLQLALGVAGFVFAIASILSIRPVTTAFLADGTAMSLPAGVKVDKSAAIARLALLNDGYGYFAHSGELVGPVPDSLKDGRQYLAPYGESAVIPNYNQIPLEAQPGTTNAFRYVPPMASIRGGSAHSFGTNLGRTSNLEQARRWWRQYGLAWIDRQREAIETGPVRSVTAWSPDWYGAFMISLLWFAITGSLGVVGAWVGRRVGPSVGDRRRIA